MFPSSLLYNPTILLLQSLIFAHFPFTILPISFFSLFNLLHCTPTNTLTPISRLSSTKEQKAKTNMCTSKAKVTTSTTTTVEMSRINGRPVLQPTCNRVPSLDRRNSLKKNIPPIYPPPPPSPLTSSVVANGSRAKASHTPPLSPNSKFPPSPAGAVKRGGTDPNSLNSSSDKVCIPRNPIRTLDRKRSKSFKEGMGNSNNIEPSLLSYSSSMLVEASGSIAAVRREQVALQQAQRKMKIAHYGRSKSAKFESKIVPIDNTKSAEETKRCHFITPNSDPIYVAYHDEEWGVPIHDDIMLFELLALSGAQVGSDWTSILKKRHDFRDAFSGFDAETVSSFTEKQITTISSKYGIDISRVRGVVDNSNRILEVKRDFGSFGKYIWGFVNQKPMSTQYKFDHKIPVKTSKSESISKHMVRRGFRNVGPTVVHSFMQAAGLTNDHLITCHRHLPCALLAIQRPLPVDSQLPVDQ